METNPEESAAVRFGRLITQLARERGYDMSPGTGGRAALARDLEGMSQSAVSRMLDGKTLPMPSHYELIARVLHTDVRHLLVTARVISPDSWPEGSYPDVRSPNSPPLPLTPEEAADAWGITNPVIRSMLLGNIEQAIRLQREAEGTQAAHNGS